MSALSDLIRSGPPRRSSGLSVFLIAEAGVNHEGSLDTAKRMIDAAARAGADAIKFQTYRAETLAAKESPAYWDLSLEPTTSQYELFRRHDSFWKTEYEQLKNECDRAGVEFLSTPFDVESAAFLNDLMDVFKVSSSDITNLPFLRLIGGFGKPVLLSTGASLLWEIAEAVSILEESENPLCLMHCILSYPTRDDDANLGMIGGLRDRFPNVVIGYSDHTLPNDEMDIVTTAVLCGAAIVEKHFTLDKALPGNDHYHAMDPQDIREVRTRLSRISSLLGSSEKRVIPAEFAARTNARRSLVTAHPLTVGQVVTEDVLTWKRPASGISPREVHSVIGMRARVEIAADTVLQWNMLE